jgi:hypothetical protein
MTASANHRKRIDTALFGERERDRRSAFWAEPDRSKRAVSLCKLMNLQLGLRDEPCGE